MLLGDRRGFTRPRDPEGTAQLHAEWSPLDVAWRLESHHELLLSHWAPLSISSDRNRSTIRSHSSILGAFSDFPASVSWEQHPRFTTGSSQSNHSFSNVLVVDSPPAASCGSFWDFGVVGWILSIPSWDYIPVSGLGSFPHQLLLTLLSARTPGHTRKTLCPTTAGGHEGRGR